MLSKKRDSDHFLSPLKSWDILAAFLQEQAQLQKTIENKAVLKNFQKEFLWDINYNTLLENKEYDALVLTSNTQKIQWVSKGFTTMTGYSKAYAIDKYPRFLQGEQTCEKTKKRIREKIAQKIPFTETVINYRKQGDKYHCEVSIIPLYSKKKKQYTHFLAIEKKVA